MNSTEWIWLQTTCWWWCWCDDDDGSWCIECILFNWINAPLPLQNQENRQSDKSLQQIYFYWIDDDDEKEVLWVETPTRMGLFFSQISLAFSVILWNGSFSQVSGFLLWVTFLNMLQRWMCARVADLFLDWIARIVYVFLRYFIADLRFVDINFTWFEVIIFVILVLHSVNLLLLIYFLVSINEKMYNCIHREKLKVMLFASTLVMPYVSL